MNMHWLENLKRILSCRKYHDDDKNGNVGSPIVEEPPTPVPEEQTISKSKEEKGSKKADTEVLEPPTPVPEEQTISKSKEEDGSNKADTEVLEPAPEPEVVKVPTPQVPAASTPQVQNTPTEAGGYLFYKRNGSLILRYLKNAPMDQTRNETLILVFPDVNSMVANHKFKPNEREIIAQNFGSVHKKYFEAVLLAIKQAAILHRCDVELHNPDAEVFPSIKLALLIGKKNFDDRGDIKIIKGAKSYVSSQELSRCLAMACLRESDSTFIDGEPEFINNFMAKNSTEIATLNFRRNRHNRATNLGR